MKRPILVTVPHYNFRGGVGNMFKVLKMEKTDKIVFFYNTSSWKHGKWLFVVWMIFKFVSAILDKRVVHLNPSFDSKAIIRDGMLLLISKLLGKKVIVFIHGWDDAFEKTVIQNRIYNGLLCLVYGQADSYILLGEVFSRKLERLGVRCKKIDFSPTVAEAPSNLPLRNQVNDGTPIQLLFIAGFVSTKGMDIVLQSFAQLIENKDYSFELTMAGDGPELKKWKEYVRSTNLKKVTFTGHVSGKIKEECFRNADILFFPTCYGEGLPCVIMEAMMYGLAIVTRPVGAIPSWVKHNVNGWLSESKDPATFAGGILELVSRPDLLASIRNLNSQIAISSFTPAKIRHRIENVYLEILNDNAKQKRIPF